MRQIRNFLDEAGRLTGFPAKRKMKIYALEHLAGKFAPGVVYTEGEVNDLLNAWHTFGDPATLRRELYDFHFLDRTSDGRRYTLASPPPDVEAMIARIC